MILYALLVLSVNLVCSEDKFLNNLPKCALKDEECLRRLYEQVVQSIGENGIPELDIPPVDPMELKNITVSVLGLIDLSLVKGIATGVSTCVFDKLTFNLTEGSGHIENTCSIKIEGKYKLRANNPLIKNLVGTSSIYGDGNGKVSIDRLHLTFDFPVYAEQRSDGEIYVYSDYNNIIYDYKILGGVKFYADDVHLGDQEISKEIIPLLNQNWKFVMNTFGKPFIDKAMEFCLEFSRKFFNTVPAKYYITDDLTSYARS